MHIDSEGLHIAADIGDTVGDDLVVFRIEIAFQQKYSHTFRHIEQFSDLGGAFDDP